MAQIRSISIILYLAQFGWGSSFPQNTTLRERIPTYLQQLCPGSGVCLNDIINPDDDTSSCCGVCSCSEDCEIKGNCCFHNQSNKTINTATSATTQTYSKCLYPVANMKEKTLSRSAFQSYRMTSLSQNDTNINGTANNAVTCGEVKVAPWGSMFPAYSKSTGKIYKNMVCAEAHNVTDGELWDFYISCYKDETFDFITRFQSGFLPEDCVVSFFYKGGMSLFKSEQCYNKEYFEASCTKTNFRIPTFLEVTREEIVVACESGLVSPYKKLQVYANIFCYICNTMSGDLLEEDQGQCSDKNYIDGMIKNGITPFTIVFDSNMLRKFTEDSVQTDRHDDARIACPEDSETQTGEGCRKISCQIGQMFRHDDGCMYSGNKWSAKRIYINIDLYADRTINISNLLRSKQNLKSPWPNSWALASIVYAEYAVPLQTSCIVVSQRIQLNRPFNPIPFFAMVKNYISKPWYLVSNNVTIRLQAEISKFKFLSTQHLNTLKVYTKIYNTKELHKRVSITITKLFFCQHVTLLPHEYSINSSLEFLFNKITQTNLFNGEFKVVENEHGAAPIVCLEDSGLYRAPPSNANKIIFCGTIFQCLAIVFVKILIFV